MSTRVGIVIAAYRVPYRTGNLERALRSCAIQDYQNFEIVIVDNAPEPTAQSIIDRNWKLPQPIHVIENNEIQSPTYARNLGWQYVQKLGIPWTFFLDDDDTLYSPNSLSSLVKEVVNKENFILVYGIQRDINTQGKLLGLNNRTIHDLSDFFLEEDIGRISFPIKAVLWSTQYLGKLGGLDSKYQDAYEDIAMAIEAFILANRGEGKIAHVNEIIAEWKKFGPGAYSTSIKNGAQKRSRLLLKERIYENLFNSAKGL